MNEKIYNDVSSAIAVLSQKLGVAAEHVYGVLVRQQVAEGIFSLVAIALCIIGIFIASKFAKYGLSIYEKHEDTAFLIVIIAGAGIIIMLSASIFNTSGVLKIVNPEYYAIQEITKMVK